MLVHASRALTDEVLAATAELSTLDDLLAELARLAVERRRVGALYQWGGRHLVGEDQAFLRASLTTLLDRLTGAVAAAGTVLATRARLLAGLSGVAVAMPSSRA